MSRNYLLTTSLFLLCFASAFLWPFLALIAHSYIPRSIGLYLFFWPQMSLPYTSMIIREDYSSVPVFTDLVGNLLNIAQWIFITLVFSLATVKIGKKRYILVLSFLTVAIVPMVVVLAASALGYTVEYDGP